MCCAINTQLGKCMAIAPAGLWIGTTEKRWERFLCIFFCSFRKYAYISIPRARAKNECPFTSNECQRPAGRADLNNAWDSYFDGKKVIDVFIYGSDRAQIQMVAIDYIFGNYTKWMQRRSNIWQTREKHWIDIIRCSTTWEKKNYQPPSLTCFFAAVVPLHSYYRLFLWRVHKLTVIFTSRVFLGYFGWNSTLFGRHHKPAGNWDRTIL